MSNKLRVELSDIIMIFYIMFSYSLNELFVNNEQFSTAVFICNNIALFVYVWKTGLLQIINNKQFTLSILFIIFQFGIQVCIGNLSLLLDTQKSNAGWIYMNKSMLLSMLACFIMALSTRSGRAYRLGEYCKNKVMRKKEVRSLSAIVTISLFIASTVAFLYAMSIGIYGYADNSNLRASIEYASTAQYIIYIADLGNLLLFMSFYIATKYNSQKEKVLTTIFLLIRIALALISGMKKELIAIFICLFLINYIVKKKISVRSVVLIVLAVIIGYGVIEVYRVALRSGAFSGNRVSLLLYVLQSGSYSTQGDNLFLYSFLSRLNITEPCSAIVKYKDTIGLSDGDPTFLMDLLLLPITIFIPRSLIPFKSMGTYGLWVSHTVLHMPSSVYSASYVTVQGFFYLAAGIIGVVIGFWILTKVLEFASGYLSDFDNPVLFATFLVITYKVIIEPSTPVAVITSVVRSIIIFTIFGSIAIIGSRKKTAVQQHSEGDSYK